MIDHEYIDRAIRTVREQHVNDLEPGRRQLELLDRLVVIEHLHRQEWVGVTTAANLLCDALHDASMATGSGTKTEELRNELAEMIVDDAIDEG